MQSKRKKIKNIILAAVVALAALAMALLPVLLQASRTEEDGASILNTRTERRSIRTTISGGGALSGADAKKISLPHGVEVTGYLVKNGQNVEAGQPLAAVDRTTVMQTIATVQKNLEYLDTQMSSVGAPKTQTTLSSPVPGRVKAVYAQAGDAVSDVMAQHGALALISLDGRMAVQVDTEESAAVGEAVHVFLAQGKALDGRVERRQGNTITVTFTDQGPTPGERAEVRRPDGTVLGEGEIYVHSAWSLCASSGVVKEMYIRAEEQVSRGYGLCYLEQMDGNGRFDQLASQRRDYEQTLNELFTLYEAGAVAAPETGVVAGIDEAKVGVLGSGAAEATLVLLGDGDPEPEPDPDPNNTEPSAFQNKTAVVGTVTFGSVSFLSSNDYVTVGSYAAATEPDYSQVTAQTLYSFSGVKVFQFNADTGAWTLSSPSVLTMGQLVYLAYDSENNLKWVLIPAQPQPEIPEELEIAIGGGGPAKPFEMYDLTETEIMRLAPQSDMTVKVKIDEMDILFVAPGQEAEITVDALPGRSFVGHVQEIDPKGVNSGGRTRYTVTISVERQEELLSGMNATAILTVGVTEDILTLPVAALEERGSRTLVYTGYDPQSGELLLPVEVETGISDGVRVEILSGLEEGQEVFYSYYETAAMPELAALPGELA